MAGARETTKLWDFELVQKQKFTREKVILETFIKILTKHTGQVWLSLLAKWTLGAYKWWLWKTLRSVEREIKT